MIAAGLLYLYFFSAAVAMALTSATTSADNPLKGVSFYN